jgi:hypothetical protein
MSLFKYSNILNKNKYLLSNQKLKKIYVSRPELKMISILRSAIFEKNFLSFCRQQKLFSLKIKMD